MNDENHGIRLSTFSHPSSIQSAPNANFEDRLVFAQSVARNDEDRCSGNILRFRQLSQRGLCWRFSPFFSLVFLVMSTISSVVNIRTSSKSILSKVAKKASSRKNVVSRSSTVTNLHQKTEKEKETCSAPNSTTSPPDPDILPKVHNTTIHDYDCDHGIGQVQDLPRDRSYSLPSSCTAPLPLNYKALRDRLEVF